MKKTVWFSVLIFVVMLLSTTYAFSDTLPLASCTKEYASLDDAVQDTALLYLGYGFWPDADIEVVGCEIMEQHIEGENLVTSAFLCHGVYDIGVDKVELVAGGLTPARLTFRFAAPSGYTIIDFQTPRDGEHLENDIKEMFSDDVYSMIYNNDGDRYKMEKLAQESADNIAKKYSSRGVNENEGIWRTFLTTGSNARAFDILLDSPLYSGDERFPFFEGDVISNGVRYRLSIEGEKSYSGTLSFSSYSLDGTELSYCKVVVEDDRLVLLDGQYP